MLTFTNIKFIHFVAYKLILNYIALYYDSDLGIGFAWKPSSLNVKVGDTVHWKWTTPDLVQGVKYKVEQTANALANESKSNGFDSGGEGSRNGEEERYYV